MLPIRIRPFSRTDREQLAFLVNAHVAAVVPGASVSIQTVLSHLEAEPGEFLIDRWVAERRTLIAEQRGRVVAAAHLLRYESGEEVGASYRGAGEISWLLFWPPAPFWPDSADAATQLMQTCLRQLDAWRVRQAYADGSLPAPGVFGVPAQWPHIRRLYRDAGFGAGRTETVLSAPLASLGGEPRPEPEGLALIRTLGVNGTRFAAEADEALVGYLEVDTNLGESGRFVRGTGWADVGNLWVDPDWRRRGIATWLLGHAARWLALGGLTGLLAYLAPESPPAERDFLAAAGFTELTTTVRGWSRVPAPGQTARRP